MDSLSATIEQSQCSLLSQIPLEDAMKRKQMQAHLRLRFTAPGSAPSGWQEMRGVAIYSVLDNSSCH